MNDKDFDQIFSDKLNEVSEFSGADDNWQKLKFRLDLAPPVPAPVLPAPPAPKIGWQQGWMYAAMSALAVGNVWLWLQMRDVNRQNEALQKAVAAVQTNRKDTVYRTDTIYQKVYLIDSHSNSENLTSVTPAEYAALSAKRASQNRTSDAASSQSIESKNLKNGVSIEDKKQQNINNSDLNRSAKASNNTIGRGSKPFNTTKNVKNVASSNVSNKNDATKNIENIASSNVSNKNDATKSVENIASSNFSNKNNATKSIENKVGTPISNHSDIAKSDPNPTLTPISNNADNSPSNTFVANAPTPDLATPKADDRTNEQNNILNKTDLVLLPLDLKPLLPVEPLEKEQESMSIAGTIQPIKVKRQYKIFPKLSMPEVNIGLVFAGMPGKHQTNGFGIGTDIGLSRNWSVIASLEKHEAHFNMGRRDERFEPPPPRPGFEFTHLEGEFKDFRLCVGTKYVFLTSKKFRPYVLAQHVWKKAPPSFVAFKYQKPTGETDELPQTIESKSFANIWQTGAGVTGDFNNRFSWNAGLNYMFDFNKANHNTNPFTLRAGIYYRL
jgi:hypothetical protein